MSTEGDALRAAARDLIDRFPTIHGTIVGRLNLLARRYDTELALREQREALARRDRATAMDTRGRWVRRVKGNGGPGVPGVGHIATTTRRTPLNDTEALCGAQLRGALEWGHPAVATAAPEAEWRPCRPCLRVLDHPAPRLVREPAA